MKLIAIEEHFLTSEIRAAWASSAIGQEGTAGFDRGEIEEGLNDLGQGRIALMDESGVEVQVLSVTTPALHKLEPEESLILARRTNDLVAATIANYPTRFQGFATLPTAAPEDAALEPPAEFECLPFADWPVRPVADRSQAVWKASPNPRGEFRAQQA
ncbi:MAG: hypothetical protein ABI380_11150 [Edaphobacter sp.]